MSFSVPSPPIFQIFHPRKGQIQLIFGPMFSGKTTELIRRCRRYQIANYKCVVVKYARDQRYAEKEVATHDKQTLPAISALELGHIRSDLDEYDVIGIDEGQFFPDVVEICEELANDGKTVIVAALDGTYQREAFGRILDLVPKAEHLIKLTAVCMGCYSDASFTRRKGEEKAIEVIGGSELYAAFCRECYTGTSKNTSNSGLFPNIRSQGDLVSCDVKSCFIDGVAKKLELDENTRQG